MNAVDKIVNFYVLLIKAGKKDLDTVDSRYRAKVREALEAGDTEAPAAE